MRRLHLFLLCIAVLPILAACSGLPKGTVNNQKVTVTVAPPTPTLSTFGKQTFTQVVTGTTSTAVTWQVNGVTGESVTTGTISTSGAYSAPHFISRSINPANTSKPVTVAITADDLPHSWRVAQFDSRGD